MLYLLLILITLTPKNVFSNQYSYPELFGPYSLQKHKPGYTSREIEPFFETHNKYTSLNSNQQMISSATGNAYGPGIRVHWNTTALLGNMFATNIYVYRTDAPSFVFTFPGLLPQGIDIPAWVVVNAQRYQNFRWLDSGMRDPKLVQPWWIPPNPQPPQPPLLPQKPDVIEPKKKLDEIDGNEITDVDETMDDIDVEKDILPKNCGPVYKSNSKNKIIQGRRTAIKRHPWQVAILYKDETIQLCGGSILTKKHVLSAGHCFYQPETDVRLNTDDLYIAAATSVKADMKRDSTNSYEIARVFIHGKYQPPAQRRNDLALVELASPIKFNALAKPVCLPPANTEYTVNKRCKITGWGRTDNRLMESSNHLRMGTVHLIADKVCEACYKVNETITQGMFCAGDVFKGGSDSCQGDSGGPLVCKNESEDRYYLYGVTSFGIECGVKHRPGVYVRVTAYRDWILRQLETSVLMKSRRLDLDEDIL